MQTLADFCGTDVQTISQSDNELSANVEDAGCHHQFVTPSPHDSSTYHHCNGQHAHCSMQMYLAEIHIISLKIDQNYLITEYSQMFHDITISPDKKPPIQS